MKNKNDFKIGDTVSVINDTLTGKIVAIEKDVISIECMDGFIYTFNSKELVLPKNWHSMIKHPIKKDVNDSSNTIKNQFISKKGSIAKEVDLHIHELVESELGMSSFQKLSLQLNTAKRELERAIDKKQQKIIFIHGRGEGVLKSELRSLIKTYPVTFHDASYQEYGQGATEVIIFQNKKKFY